MQVPTVLLLYPMMISFERRRQSAAEVSYHVRFTSCMLIGKLLLSALTTLVVIDAENQLWFVLACTALLHGQMAVLVRPQLATTGS